MNQAPNSSTEIHSSDEASRDAMSVEDGPQPRLGFPVVGIGASAGGLEAFTEFFDAMPPDRGLAFVLVQHLSPKHESMVAELLQKHTAMPVRQVVDGMAIEPNHVYVIRPGNTMTIKDGRLRLGESLLNSGHSRPVDDFFKSLAEEQRERAICVILSGMGSNGSAGAQGIKVVGGLGVAQEPNSAKFPSMPRSMIDANLADFILKPAEMPEVLLRYADHAYVREEPPADLVARTESHQVNDILAILRARVRHDFSGYKRPTIVRRIQRRMSLTQNSVMADYARVLRQTPAEVQNLSDDLLIHVTGFFRDAEVWEGLRERVIQPMVAEKPDQASIRVWVTACASGEEAYTLAMLLVEAAEQVDKQFDIKVFATDMAERALNHARAGIFPGGIESEVKPERLARFFDRDESMYRVKKHLRELVVFAPQNVLQDPPFSRLDIVTCRNLLIYLEPEVQQRVLSLLHFGLREGGVLVLGNSETIGEQDDELFEAIDKKLRLYRRTGPTRHGRINFPDRRPRQAAAGPATEAKAPLSRASLSHATTKTLLDHHSPPSVVVDRHGRIAYFHGQTRLFLGQPSGEPTRDLLELALDFVRGSIRVALHGAVETGKPAVSKDGVIEIDGVPHRVEVHAMPVEQRSLQGYYLVSFVHYPVSQMVVKSDVDGDSEGSLHEELRTLRDELQSTIEELQTSNEEMNATHEEVTSVNEELQSANEELETSKEELQSLNEELTTVNAQLEAKMEESERTGNDLTSLLASSDTAVIFLDRQLRVRRFTPASKPLIDLLPADVGRPLSDFACKFDDPNLLDAARGVLATLVPDQASVVSDAGRWYSRRVLPYRTADDRIDGVVINFIDISDLKRAESAVRDSEERFRVLVTASSDTIYRMSPDWTEMWSLVGKEFIPTTNHPTDSWLHKYIPAEEQPRVRAAVRAAIDARRPFEMEHRVTRVDGSVGWTFSRAIPVLGPDGAIREWFGTASDITARKEAEAAVRASEEKYRTLFDSIDEGFCIIEILYEHGRPVDYRFVEANPAFERQAGFSGVVGRRMLELVPGHETHWFETYGRIAETGTPARLQQEAAALGRHYDVYAFRVAEPELRRVAVIFTDITARRQTDERQAFLLKLSDALRPLADPVAIEVEATRVLGEHLGVGRVLYAEVEPDEDHVLIHRDFTASGTASIAGRQKLSGFGTHWVEGYRAGRTLASSDFQNVGGSQAAAFEAIGVRACVGVPVNKHGKLVGVLIVHSPVPREWTPLEIALVEATAERTWAAVERAKTQEALRESETRYSTLTTNLPHGAAFVVDSDLRYTLAEGQALSEAGFTPADLVGKTLAEALPPELAAEYEPFYRAALAGETFRHEHTAHGRSFVTHGGPLRDAAGRVYAAMAVSYDISDRKRAEADRATLLDAEQHARTAAEAANAGKDQFLANLSHELRTPLSAMLIWSNVLQDQADPATLAEGLAAIEQSARAQQKLIDDLLDSARIATGKMSLELRPVDLGEVIRNAAAALRHTTDAKGVELRMGVGKTVGVVMADADRLRQVVWNLINNAVKFTPAGGRVDVGVSRLDGTVEIRVADTGLGIDADLLPQVFGRFQQADPSRTRRHGGLGLGLSISRQIVELHGGTIQAASDGPGRGSVFTVILPLKRTRSTARPPGEAAELAGVRVVLVEDDAQLRDVVTMLLQRAGATVESFAMADPAKAALLADPPDVLLSDIGLPDKDGYALIRELREELGGGVRLPAIAFTAFDRTQDRTHAIESGFDRHLAKPVDPTRLIQTVRALLRSPKA